MEEYRHSNYVEIVEAIAQNLREFGYTALSEVYVLTSYYRAMKGDRPVSIIDMMVRDQLRENGLLPVEGYTTDF